MEYIFSKFITSNKKWGRNALHSCSIKRLISNLKIRYSYSVNPQNITCLVSYENMNIKIMLEGLVLLLLLQLTKFYIHRVNANMQWLNSIFWIHQPKIPIKNTQWQYFEHQIFPNSDSVIINFLDVYISHIQNCIQLI